MKNYSKYIVALAIALPLVASAQTATTTRARNVEANRDYRNTVMMKRPLVREAIRAEVHLDGPKWLAATSTTLGRMLSEATLKELRMASMKLASSTAIEGHENWKKARLDVFVSIQTRLISQITQSLNGLKAARTKIADRIQTATTNGKDMSESVRLLAVADAKLTSADSALQDLVSLVPPVTNPSASANISTSTEVSLEKPRVIGNAAIKAVLDAKKALSDVIVAIAKTL